MLKGVRRACARYRCNNLWLTLLAEFLEGDVSLRIKKEKEEKERRVQDRALHTRVFCNAGGSYRRQGNHAGTFTSKLHVVINNINA